MYTTCIRKRCEAHCNGDGLKYSICLTAVHHNYLVTGPGIVNVMRLVVTAVAAGCIVAGYYIAA